jgi:hypothetical protein
MFIFTKLKAKTHQEPILPKFFLCEWIMIPFFAIKLDPFMKKELYSNVTNAQAYIENRKMKKNKVKKIQLAKIGEKLCIWF